MRGGLVLLLFSGVVRGEECANSDAETERSLLSSGIGAASVGEGVAGPPVIDLEKPQGLWQAAKEFGFFTVTNHGFPSSLIEKAFEVSETFFGQEVSTKEAQSPYSAKLNSGYEYMRQVRPSTGLPDVKESFQITARDEAMEGRWPPGVEDVAKEFMREAQVVADKIVAELEKNLDNIETGTLARAHTLWTNESQITLRMIHYPPPPPSPPGSFRAGAHTDWGIVTLLFQLPGNEGLECASQKDNAWLPVDPVQGGIAVNVGDMLARWSDNAILSNLHRVRMPTDITKPRYSLAYFAQADKNQIITVRSDDNTFKNMTAADYLQGRLKSNYDKKAF